MNGPEITPSGAARKEPNANGLYWLIAFVVGAALLCFLAFFFFLFSLDRTGTFYVGGDAADLDGDGDQDVLVHNMRQESEFTAFSGTVPWFNQGNGKFDAHRLQQGTEGGGWDSAAGDVDGDGDTDLLVFLGYKVRLLLNQGGGQGGQEGEFKNSQVILGPEGNGQYGTILLGDLNSDGWLDGIVVGCCGRLFTVDPDDDSLNVSGMWLNNEGRLGVMSQLSALDGLAVRGAALGDLDGDGDLDLFAAITAPEEGRNRNPADRVLLNDGAGNFSDSGQRLGDWDSTAVALGDVDRDGDLDALTGSEQGTLLWANQGGAQGGAGGIFILSGPTVGRDLARSIFLEDLDSDGDLDALIGEQRQATIWWNDGQAVFTEDRRRLRTSQRHGLILGDFNGDGYLDIFAPEYDNNYRLWLNRGDGSFSRTK